MMLLATGEAGFAQQLQEEIAMVDSSEHFAQVGGEQAPAHQGWRDAAGAPLSQQHPAQDWITRARASLIERSDSFSRRSASVPVSGQFEESTSDRGFQRQLSLKELLKEVQVDSGDGAGDLADEELNAARHPASSSINSLSMRAIQLSMQQTRRDGSMHEILDYFGVHEGLEAPENGGVRRASWRHIPETPTLAAAAAAPMFVEGNLWCPARRSS
jgi:hypothetical protein